MQGLSNGAVEDIVVNEESLVAVTRDDYNDVMVPNYAPQAIIPVRGQGSHVWDQEDNKYIDMAAGIAVTSLGHCHPDLNEVLQQQSQMLWHSSNIFTNEPALRLAKKLTELTFAEQVFFANSGAEANEAALKLARRYAKDNFGAEKNQIIAFNQSFHGRTFFTVTTGGQVTYSDGFGPKPGAIDHIDYNDLAALETLISDITCAVIIEPMQGEGGIHPVSEAFIIAVRALCDKYNALLIFDEVQTGVGRLGHFYAYQTMPVIPDILTSAKGLGGGFPIAAMLTTKVIAKHLSPGTHGSTYGGNPLACAVAGKVVELVSDTEFLQQVTTKSTLLKTGLDKLNQQFAVFNEIRGQGLLIGAELKAEYQGCAGEIMQQALVHGLIILVAGADVLRFAPALNIASSDIELALEKLTATISQWQSNRT